MACNCLSSQIKDESLRTTNSETGPNLMLPNFYRMQMLLPLSAFRDKTDWDQQLASPLRVVMGEILSLDASAIRRSSISPLLLHPPLLPPLSVRQSPLRLMIFCGRRNGHLCDFTLGCVNHISLPNKMQFHTTEAKQYPIVDIYFGAST